MGETGNSAASNASGAGMDITGLATIVKSVSDLLIVGFQYAFGGEAARKQAALEDSARINPWLYPGATQPAQKDNTLLYVVVVLGFVFMVVLLLAYLKGERKEK